MLETQPSFRFLLSCVQLVFLGTGIRTSFAGEVEVRDVASLVAALSYGQEGDLIHVAAGEYKVGASLRPKQGMKIIGAGAGATFIRCDSGWRAPLNILPDNGVDRKTANGGSYLFNLIEYSHDVQISDMTLQGNGLHGAVYGAGVDRLRLARLEVRDFAWAGIRTFGTNDVRISNSVFVDNGGKFDETVGAAIYLSSTTAKIRDNRIVNSGNTDREMFGIKGLNITRSRISYNTIRTNFAIEMPFADQEGVEIHNNWLGGVISIPLSWGGSKTRAGESFRIHHNYFTTSYSIEGPRNGLEIDHNLFDFSVDDDQGNLMGCFGDHFEAKLSGPISFHDNAVVNPGRGVFWSDRVIDRLTFENNHIRLDESSPSIHPEGLFGIRATSSQGATNFDTVTIRNNIIEIKGKPRPLVRNSESTEAVIENNRLVNVS